MTPQQESCLLFIQKSIAENGYAPTFTTLADHLDVERKDVFQILNALVEDGRISIDCGLSKTIQVIRPIIEGRFFVFDEASKELRPYTSVRAFRKESARA